MIKKLRFKFIALSMGLLFIVLVLIMGIVNILNYYSVVVDADSVLQILIDNNGSFPNMKDMKPDRQAHILSPELPYESRYFTVHLDSNGNVIFSDTGKIAAVDTETAIAYAEAVLDSAKQTGFIEAYRYQKAASGDGSLIVFLDCGRRMRDVQKFLLISCGIALSGFLLVFLLIVLLSKRVVKPFSENLEKQKQFITDAGHELKTPLTIIDADASVLEMDIGEDNEWLQDIQKQTKRMADLTNALVYLSRMEEENHHFQMIEFPLSDVVTEVSQSFQALAVSQNKPFALEIDPMLSVCGDEKALRQLVSILLDNALKYSTDGGKISLSLKQVKHTVQLCVQNTCEPIAQEEREHLFDRFYRADPSRNSASGGYGIGLSLAKAIVTAHKGSIQASAPTEKELRITAIIPMIT